MPDPKRLDDGMSTILHFEQNPTVKFYEMDVTPPGMDAGGPINTTNMRNNRLRTQSPKKLKTLTAVQASVMYNSDVFDADQVWAMLGINQEVTIEFPDNSMLQFWGWLDKFIPGGAKEGEVMLANITVEPSNHNNDATPLEVDPQYLEPVSVTEPEPYYDYSSPPTADPTVGDE